MINSTISIELKQRGIEDGERKNQKGNLGGFHGKPTLFHYTAAKEAGIPKSPFATSGLSSLLCLWPRPDKWAEQRIVSKRGTFRQLK